MPPRTNFRPARSKVPEIEAAVDAKLFRSAHGPPRTHPKVCDVNDRSLQTRLQRLPTGVDHRISNHGETFIRNLIELSPTAALGVGTEGRQPPVGVAPGCGGTAPPPNEQPRIISRRTEI